MKKQTDEFAMSKTTNPQKAWLAIAIILGLISLFWNPIAVFAILAGIFALNYKR